MTVNMATQSNSGILPLESTLDYWRDVLVDVESCVIPESENCNCDTEDTIQIPLPTDQLMQTLCEQHGLTPQDVFLTAWATVLRYYAGVNPVCFVHSVYEHTFVSGSDGSPRPPASIFIYQAELKRENLVVRVAKDAQTALHGHSSHAMHSANTVQRLLDLYAAPPFNTEVKLRKIGSLDSITSGGRSVNRDAEGTHKVSNTSQNFMLVKLLTESACSS